MPQLSEFVGAHYGEAMVVCGLGASLNTLRKPERFCTIGVNDIGRAFTPTYLFVMDAPKSFDPERFQFIQQSQASYIFTDQELDLTRPNIVKFPIRSSPTPRFDDPTALYLIGRPSTSPFLAICLAAHMGAKAIGLIGVDFTNGHFFKPEGVHKLAKSLAGINRRFYQLGSALLERGVQVFNLSQESRLNAFPRLNADEFYALQKSGVSRSWSRPARRVCLLSASPPDENLQTLARLINLRTTLSCRLIAPGSPDIRPATTPEIEADVLSKATVKVNCDQVRLPNVTAVNGDFLHVWNDQLRPLLFGRPGVQRDHRPRRAFSVGVIVSQESATGDEVVETLRSLWTDLLPQDELMVLGCHAKSERSAPWLRRLKRARYVEPVGVESYVAARNRVAASFDKDILIFTDANVQAPQDWVSSLLEAFEDPAVGAAGPAIVDLYTRDSKGYGMKWIDAELRTAWLPECGRKPFPVPLLPGIFLAVRRSTFTSLGGFDAGMRGSGGDDVELCFRLWTRGFRCVVIPELEVQWMNAYAAGAIRSPEYWGDLLYNLLRLTTVHFGAKRRREFAKTLALDPLFSSARALLKSSDASQRRARTKAERKYSEKWFFERFPI